MRNLCAPVPLRSVNIQLALCNGLVGLVCWLGLIGISFLLYGGLLEGTDIRLSLIHI